MKKNERQHKYYEMQISVLQLSLILKEIRLLSLFLKKKSDRMFLVVFNIASLRKLGMISCSQTDKCGHRF